MDKLTFYSMSSPEKLDRIGEYLAQKVSRDIYRGRNSMVVIAMEAMTQILQTCHAPSLNLFVESFLKTVQKLLETTDPQLQVLASESVRTLKLVHSPCLNCVNLSPSSLLSPTLKRTRHRITEDTTSSCRNLRLCVIAATQRQKS